LGHIWDAPWELLGLGLPKGLRSRHKHTPNTRRTRTHTLSDAVRPHAGSSTLSPIYRAPAITGLSVVHLMSGSRQGHPSGPRATAGKRQRERRKWRKKGCARAEATCSTHKAEPLRQETTPLSRSCLKREREHKLSNLKHKKAAAEDICSS